jgi:hypothetical protein
MSLSTNYLPKARGTVATGAPVDERLKALKKKDLAVEAEKSVAGTRWLPEPLRN